MIDFNWYECQMLEITELMDVDGRRATIFVQKTIFSRDCFVLVAIDNINSVRAHA
jgi:hypothetical protein